MAATRTRRERTGYVRTLYTGQGHRGGPDKLRVAIVDLGQAIAALTAARDELEVALHATDRQRERLVVDAHDRIRLGIRFASQARSGRKPKKPAAKTQLRLKLGR